MLQKIWTFSNISFHSMSQKFTKAKKCRSNSEKVQLLSECNWGAVLGNCFNHLKSHVFPLIFQKSFNAFHKYISSPPSHISILLVLQQKGEEVQILIQKFYFDFDTSFTLFLALKHYFFALIIERFHFFYALSDLWKKGGQN